MDDYIEASFVKAVVDLKMSKQDFLDCTPYEIDILYTRHIDAFMERSNVMRNLFATAVAIGVNGDKKAYDKPFFDMSYNDAKVSADIPSATTMEDIIKIEQMVEENESLKDQILRERAELFDF